MESRTEEIAGKKLKRKDCWNLEEKEDMARMLKIEYVLLLRPACNPSSSYNGCGGIIKMVSYTEGIIFPTSYLIRKFNVGHKRSCIS
jgi:hypothetical protein